MDICKWGCGEWVRVGHEQDRHEKMDCSKRILPCTLGCQLAQPYEVWEKCLGESGTTHWPPAVKAFRGGARLRETWSMHGCLARRAEQTGRR